MAKQSGSIQILDIDGLDPASRQSLKARVETHIRRAILTGNFLPGARLPSSRVLAHDLNVSRHTVEWAFDQLQSEGFLVRRKGSGTFVSSQVPERERPPETGVGTRSRIAAPPAPLSRRGEVFAGYPGQLTPTVGTAFTPSIPAIELFPRRVWERLLSRSVRRSGTEYWAYGASAGLPELRQAIAAHVAGSRAVACSPDQVIVMSSAQQAVDLVSRVLIDPGEAAWIEDPCYPPTMHLLRAAGAVVVPIPVDLNGLDVSAALAVEPAARLAYVTPSHQYPSGGLMSLERRQALLAWAQRADGWVIEDDYDGDLRYAGRPLASLQALDPAGRVIYIGTFSKMMFSSLRIAFLVAPVSLVDAFINAKHLMDGHAPGHTQAALAAFIGEGHLAAHLRAVLPEYDLRRLAVLKELALLSDELEIGPSDAGLHLSVYLRRQGDDRRIASMCAEKGVDLHPLSRFYAGAPRAGFVMGFACSRPVRTHAAMRVVGQVLGGKRPVAGKVVR
ncbi:MAG: PLP-dependent aminotransferase family protein [Gemmatimonadota bacterium]